MLQDLDDKCPSEDEFAEHITDLCRIGYLNERICDEDSVVYETRIGLQWTDFFEEPDPIKKQILLYLVDNPKTFFILYNTQKGKSRISGKELEKWSKDTNYKVVGIVIVDNDKTLAEQSSSGFKDSIGENVTVFTLSSMSGTKLPEIITYINAYGSDDYDEYKMPVIVALQNNAQIGRIIEIMENIRRKANHPTKPSKLRYGLLFDEADKTYPPVRDIFLPYIRDDSLYRLGFVTATDGDLLHLDEYEECCNAKMIQADSDSPDYRAIHTKEAAVHKTETLKLKPNDYAEKIIRENLPHFTDPIVLPSGEIYYRKVIVNSNVSVRDMVNFARNRTAMGCYAMTFNQSGITLYVPDGNTKRFKTRGRRLNENIMGIYKLYRLNDRPLYVIGRRKVDRGLGFHFAPRVKDPIHMRLDDNHPEIVIENGEGIIFTDLILGQVKDKATATQKSGRGAGIIAHCPQYPGVIHYWTDKSTADSIIQHNTMVDIANGLTGAYSAFQATTAAREQLRESTPPTAHADLSHEIFDNQDDAIQRASELFKGEVKLIKRKNAVAPKDAQVDGRNPTVEEILKRHQGLGDHKIRMLPTNENKWCIYWRPSTVAPR